VRGNGWQVFGVITSGVVLQIVLSIVVTVVADIAVGNAIGAPVSATGAAVLFLEPRRRGRATTSEMTPSFDSPSS
jgi:hypothetical protein